MEVRAALAIIAAAVVEDRLELTYHAEVEKMEPMGLFRGDIERRAVR